MLLYKINLYLLNCCFIYILCFTTLKNFFGGERLLLKERFRGCAYFPDSLAKVESHNFAPLILVTNVKIYKTIKNRKIM